jgi:hypothetical protein
MRPLLALALLLSVAACAPRGEGSAVSGAYVGASGGANLREGTRLR